MDAIFKALNDPTRRMILDRLRARDGQSLQELEAGTNLTRFGVMKHLRVLEDAALVVSRRSGRFKYHYLNAVPLQEVIDRWIEPLLAKPAARGLIDLKNRLESPMTKPDFVLATYIRCSQDALWDALLDPAARTAYDFLGSTVTRDGNVLSFTRGGARTLTFTETELDPKTRIVTTFQPEWAPAIPSSRVVYLIEPQGETCKLTVEHYGLTAEISDSVADGWWRTVSGLKTWLETGQSIHYTPAAAMA